MPGQGAGLAGSEAPHTHTHDAAWRAVLIDQLLQGQAFDQLAGQQGGRRVLLVGQAGEQSAAITPASGHLAVPQPGRGLDAFSPFGCH